MKTTIVRHALVFSTLVLLLAGCGTDQIGTVKPDIRVVPTHQTDDGQNLLDYGKVPVLNRSTLSLHVVNLGRAALTLETLELAGDEGVFRVDLPDGTVLQGGQDLEIPVVFQPQAEADYEGRITLHHNDPSKGPIEVLLDGVGSTVGRVAVEPRLLDFGRVGEGEQEIRRFTIRSEGTAPLIVESIEVIEGSPAFFFLSSTQTPASLPAPADGLPGGEVALSIACLPTVESPVDLHGKVLIRTTDPEQREVEVELVASKNEAPVAIIGPTSGVPAPGDAIALDGRESHDPDGDDPIEFFWRVVDKPHTSEAYIEDPTSPTPRLITDVAGVYRVGLDVVDAAGLSCSHPQGNPALPCAFRDVEVLSADDVVVELIWDREVPDLDLHLMEGDAPLFSAGDCHWANREPDFGEQGNPADDPYLVRDALKGYGPEEIVLSAPSAGRFHVAVVYSKANGPTPVQTKATVRVFFYGILAAEVSQVLQAPSDRWDVLTFDWPSRTITELGGVSPLPMQQQ